MYKRIQLLTYKFSNKWTRAKKIMKPYKQVIKEEKIHTLKTFFIIKQKNAQKIRYSPHGQSY